MPKTQCDNIQGGLTVTFTSITNMVNLSSFLEFSLGSKWDCSTQNLTALQQRQKDTESHMTRMHELNIQQSVTTSKTPNNQKSVFINHMFICNRMMRNEMYVNTYQQGHMSGILIVKLSLFQSLTHTHTHTHTCMHTHAHARTHKLASHTHTSIHAPYPQKLPLPHPSNLSFFSILCIHDSGICS